MNKQNIPNLLTYGRAAAVPASFAIILFAPQYRTALFVIFLLASLTDFLDGYLARKWNAVSAIGALLDPIADKLLVALLLIFLFGTFGPALLVPVVVMLLRELYISGLREFLASKQLTLPVSKGGKLKTSLQMAGILLLLFATTEWMPSEHQKPGIVLGINTLWAAAVVSLVTAVEYTRSAWKQIR